ncbi:MAG: hypothetical protein NE327_04130 [Lentisphaeraceae bacterium]|nr:hypothetical protein [Lentisphaeraceae bacterium]
MNFTKFRDKMRSSDFTRSQINVLTDALSELFKENNISTVNIDSYKTIKYKSLCYGEKGLFIDGKLYHASINGSGINFLGSNEFEIDVIAKDQNGKPLIKDNCLVIQRLRCELES